LVARGVSDVLTRALHPRITAEMMGAVARETPMFTAVVPPCGVRLLPSHRIVGLPDADPLPPDGGEFPPVSRFRGVFS